MRTLNDFPAGMVRPVSEDPSTVGVGDASAKVPDIRFPVNPVILKGVPVPPGGV